MFGAENNERWKDQEEIVLEMFRESQVNSWKCEMVSGYANLFRCT